MTPPASILAPDRNRASVVAWGTLCALVVAQLALVTKLAMNRPPVVSPVPVPGMEAPVLKPVVVPALATSPVFSAVAPSGVPEIGQIATPVIAPPPPGTLAAQPAPVIAPPISQGPPPIGSFQRPGDPAPPSAPPPTLKPQLSPAPTLPGASMPVPKLPGAEERPPLPGSSMAVPKMPGEEASLPLPGSSMAVPKMPGEEASLPLPGSSMARPKLPGEEAPPPLPGSSMPVPKMPVDEPPALPGSAMPLPKAPAPPAAAPSPAASAMPKARAAKPSAALALLQDVNYVVTNAKEIRGMSDMQGALELLQKADQVTPDHPAIIAEIAQTYEQMGITAKATDSWRRLQLLGETRAGNYYELATRRLGAGAAATAAPLAMPGSTGLEAEKHLRLGACQAMRDVTATERYTLRVPILRAGSQPVDGNLVNMEVFFFDRVNGTQVAQSIAQEPVETWQSTPVDWTGAGEETLDVVYNLPALSPAEVQQHGRRSYYGYMLRLYYNNKLQDVAAEPRDLLEFGSAPGSSAPAAGGNPLLPPVGR